MDLLLAAVHADDAVASLVEPACPEHASALRVGNEPGVEAFPEQRPSHDAAASGTRNLAGGTSRALPIAARSSVLNATARLRRRLRSGSDQRSCSHKRGRDRFRRPSHARTSAAISSRAMLGKLSLAESLRKRYLPLPTKTLYGGRMDVTPAMVTQETVAAEVRAWLGRRNRSGRSIARELGWTEPYLSRRLTGTVPFDVADLVAIADLLAARVARQLNGSMTRQEVQNASARRAIRHAPCGHAAPGTGRGHHHLRPPVRDRPARRMAQVLPRGGDAHCCVQLPTNPAASA